MATVFGSDIVGFVDRVLASVPQEHGRPSFSSSTADGLERPDYPDSLSRMFSTNVGQKSVGIVRNEGLTLSILTNLAADALVEGTNGGRNIDPWTPTQLSPDVNPLVINRSKARQEPPVLLMLDPHLPAGFEAQRVDWAPGPIVKDKLTIDAISRVATGESQPYLSPEHRGVAETLVGFGPEGLADLLWIVRPEVVVARHPEMELAGCPSPALEVQCTPAGKPPEVSSAGMFCRDADNVVGVTACHHGTGDIGIDVSLGGLPTQVKHADKIQDIVFIPLPQNYSMPKFARGLNGPRGNKAPGQGDPAQFEGRTSGHKTTVISSHSPGLLWLDPLSQNKVQTPAAVNRGDSGSALIDDDDHVLGFAFRRTKYGEPLEFAEWIWAANAMAALGLKPL